MYMLYKSILPLLPLYILNIFILPLLTSVHTEHMYPSHPNLYTYWTYISFPHLRCTCCTYFFLPSFPLNILYLFILPLLSDVLAVHIYPSPPFHWICCTHLSFPTLRCTCCTYLSFHYFKLYILYIFILPFHSCVQCTWMHITYCLGNIRILSNIVLVWLMAGRRIMFINRPV